MKACAKLWRSWMEKELNRLDEEERQTQKLITALKDFEAIMLDHMFVK